MYRILTEQKNVKEIENLVSQKFEGFTIVFSTGYWRKVKEKSIIIEIDTKKSKTVKKLAESIKRLNKQESVLIQSINNLNQFI